MLPFHDSALVDEGFQFHSVDNETREGRKHATSPKEGSSCLLRQGFRQEGSTGQEASSGKEGSKEKASRKEATRKDVSRERIAMVERLAFHVHGPQRL